MKNVQNDSGNVTNSIALTREQWRNALVERHGEAYQSRFDNGTVAICGLGGLGSNVAINLARAGVGHLILIDYDQVDVTNLHRQQYKMSQLGMNKTQALKENITEITPFIQVDTHTMRITSENLVDTIQNVDIVCEAFDDAECKAMLVNEVLTRFDDKIVVSASGMAGFDSGNVIKTKKMSKRWYLCGDQNSEVKPDESLVASRVMLCAAHEAHIILRILAGLEDE